MNIIMKVFTGASMAACMSLAAQSVYAGCSDKFSSILQITGALSSVLPAVGPVASAGADLSNLLLCLEDPLDRDQVINLIRDELDANAVSQTESAIDKFAGDLAILRDDLESDYTNIDFDSLSDTDRKIIRESIDRILGDIALAEGPFLAAFTTPNNLRKQYDLTLPLLLANYKLALLHLLRSIEPDPDLRIKVATDKILKDFTAYRQESDRLSDFNYRITTRITSLGHVADLKITRAGQTFFTGSYGCDSIFDNNCGEKDDSIEKAKRAAYQEISKQLNRLDLQNETHVALLKAKIQALRADPLADLSSVPLQVEVPVMLVNTHPNAANRCAFRSGGGINFNTGELREGTTRLRGCDPLINLQKVYLQDNGQIRSAIANLCFESVSSENKVYFLKCDDPKAVRPEQQWERDGNRFKVKFKGQTRCLSPRPDNISSLDQTFRHVTCTDSSAQEWYVFSPLQNKATPDGAVAITPNSEDFGVKANPTLCLEFGKFNSAVGFREPALATCDRYRREALWAQDALDVFRPLLTPRQVLGGRFQGAPLVLKDESASGGEYIRNEIGDGTVTFLLKKGSGRFLFPDGAYIDSLVYADIAPSDGFGQPTDVVFWKHFNGGKWSE